MMAIINHAKTNNILRLSYTFSALLLIMTLIRGARGCILTEQLQSIPLCRYFPMNLKLTFLATNRFVVRSVNCTRILRRNHMCIVCIHRDMSLNWNTKRVKSISCYVWTKKKRKRVFNLRHSSFISASELRSETSYVTSTTMECRGEVAWRYNTRTKVLAGSDRLLPIEQLLLEIRQPSRLESGCRLQKAEAGGYGDVSKMNCWLTTPRQMIFRKVVHRQRIINGWSRDEGR